MIGIIRDHTLPAAFDVLPPVMNSPAARAMLLAIGLQESRFVHRRQVNGPARGFWQFERPGVLGVVHHDRTTAHLERALRHLRYEYLIDQTGMPVILHQAIEHNDVLAAVLARLLLWTVPGRLPGREDPAAGWSQYVNGWRPGKPHPQTWATFYTEAWDLVEAAHA